MQSATQDSAIRRLTAAKWLQQVTRESVSGETDRLFRRDLADGVLLCTALNGFATGCIPEVRTPSCVECGPGPALAYLAGGVL
jgi:hypothetical protein